MKIIVSIPFMGFATDIIGHSKDEYLHDWDVQDKDGATLKSLLLLGDRPSPVHQHNDSSATVTLLCRGG